MTRGRPSMVSPKQVFSTGRGGVGNMRSPSRDVHKTPNVEEDVIREHTSHEGDPARISFTHSISFLIFLHCGRGGLAISTDLVLVIQSPTLSCIPLVEVDLGVSSLGMAIALMRSISRNILTDIITLVGAVIQISPN